MTTPIWRRPNPYGFPAAIEGAGTVSSPLLAGFSFTLIGIVLGTTNAFRWPNAALALLVGATALLIGSVQSAFWARQYVVTPGELAEWWPGLYTDPERLHEVRGEQLGHKQLHDRWVRRFAALYHGGILLMLAALAVLLVPPAAVGVGRLAAIVLAIVATVGEAAWIAATRPSTRSFKRARESLVPTLSWVDPEDMG